MRRLFTILTMLGILTACGRATSIAKTPQVMEGTKVATMEVTSVVTSVVGITAIVQSTTKVTVTTQPTVEVIVTPMPTSALTATPTTNISTASVVNGGNLRSRTNVSASTVIGQVCPGDHVAVLAQQQVGVALWYRVQIITTAANCHPKRVAIGTEGWINSSLVSQPNNAVVNAPTAAPTTVAVATTNDPQIILDIPSRIGQTRVKFEQEFGAGKNPTAFHPGDRSHYSGAGETRNYTVRGYGLFVNYNSSGVVVGISISDGLERDAYDLKDWTKLFTRVGLPTNQPPDTEAPAAVRWLNLNGYVVDVAKTLNSPIWQIQVWAIE